MKKYWIILLVTVLIACQPANKKANTTVAANTAPGTVDVYYFHQTKGCKTCKAVGALSKELVSETYEKQNNKSVAYHDVNISLTENKALADKFEVSWSGLCLLAHTTKGDVSEDLTDVAFMYALNNPDTLEQILKTKINNYLKQ